MDRISNQVVPEAEPQIRERALHQGDKLVSIVPVFLEYLIMRVLKKIFRVGKSRRFHFV